MILYLKNSSEFLFLYGISQLIFIFLLFIIGLWGSCLIRKNILITLMSIEIMLLSVNLSLIVFSFILDDSWGQVFCLVILSIAASEIAIGLAMLIVYYRIKQVIDINFIASIKG